MQPYRRITIAVGVSMFVDTSLYLAVLPLLPRYADQFNLNTFQAGLVLAAYPVSVPFVSLGCIVLVPRIGARRISLASALLMTIATVIFAWAPNVEVLILARFVQGFAAARSGPPPCPGSPTTRPPATAAASPASSWACSRPGRSPAPASAPSPPLPVPASHSGWSPPSALWAWCSPCSPPPAGRSPPASRVSGPRSRAARDSRPRLRPWP